MKRNTILLFLFILTVKSINAQDSLYRQLPSVEIRTMDNSIFNTSQFSNDGKPMIIDFWATWCKPCIEELNAINEEYAEWKKETGVKVITVSLDDARTMSRVAPFINGRSWPFENYLDPNGDLKRALNVNMPPHTFLLNGKREIVWQHVGYTEGNEAELYEMLKKVDATVKN